MTGDGSPRDLRQVKQSYLQAGAYQEGCGDKCRPSYARHRLYTADCSPRRTPEPAVSTTRAYCCCLTLSDLPLSGSRQNWAGTMWHREQGHSTSAPSSPTVSQCPQFITLPNPGAGLTPTGTAAKEDTRPMGQRAFPGSITETVPGMSFTPRAGSLSSHCQPTL